MESALFAILLALQETSASGNSSSVWGVILFAIVIAVIMVGLVILGFLSLGEREQTRRRT